ncbi:uncharacterized protein [Vulpes vulpes]|uniref:Uncharacterized protein n=1 Tax=Vulpes vulpes TaxID=9627 RepID=A0ABM5B1Y7_VULVU
MERPRGGSEAEDWGHWEARGSGPARNPPVPEATGAVAASGLRTREGGLGSDQRAALLALGVALCFPALPLLCTDAGGIGLLAWGSGLPGPPHGPCCGSKRPRRRAGGQRKRRGRRRGPEAGGGRVLLSGSGIRGSLASSKAPPEDPPPPRAGRQGHAARAYRWDVCATHPAPGPRRDRAGTAPGPRRDRAWTAPGPRLDRACFPELRVRADRPSRQDQLLLKALLQ